MCGVCLLSRLTMSATFDMTHLMRAGDLIALLLLLSGDIFHYPWSLFLCLTLAVFTAVSVLLQPGDKLCKCTQSLMLFATGRCGETDNRIVNFIHNSFFIFLNLYQELIRCIYHPGALACCSCAHWLVLPPGSPSPKYSRCSISIFPHHSRYNYELHLSLETKQSLKLEISVTNGFVLTEYKLQAAFRCLFLMDSECSH